MCVIVLSNGIYNNAYFINPTDEQVKYEGLSWQNINTVKELKGAVGFLTSNSYEVGYASFWNSNVITVITSGQISMITLSIDKVIPNELDGHADDTSAIAHLFV